MNPNQRHHTGQFQAPPLGQWQQTPPTPGPAKQKTGIPLAGAYVLAAVLGLIAIGIAIFDGNGSASATNSIDSDTADKRVCAQIQTAHWIERLAADSFNAAKPAGNKAQMADAVTGLGVASSMIETASQGSSPEVREAATSWTEQIQKWLDGKTTWQDVDAAAKKLQETACK